MWEDTQRNPHQGSRDQSDGTTSAPRAVSERAEKGKHQRGHWNIGALIHCWERCKVGLPVGEMTFQLPETLNVRISCVLAILLLEFL